MSVHLVHPEQYASQLEAKTQQTEQEFAPFDPPKLEVFASPATHYRMRAEFKIWHSGDTVRYAMFEPGRSKKPVIIDDFPVAAESINRLMPQVLEALNKNELLRHRAFQAEFLAATTDEMVLTLIYHRPLDEKWQKEAAALSSELGISIIGRSKKQKIIIGNDFVNEEFRVQGRVFRYRQVEAAFSQPNAAVCEQMLNWATEVAQPLEGDLLELYCGNGNFTLPLSRQFNRVLATEIAKSSVSTAIANIADNNIENIEIARMSSEEFTQAIEGVREFRRLQGIDLSSYAFTTAFVDPPRAGLDEGTLALVQRYQNIIYISCSPETLRRDVEALAETHRIERFAFFDQFPYTDHRECGLVLTRR
jgi:tRNA (uracil-5-)-methyltransferase